MWNDKVNKPSSLNPSLHLKRVTFFLVLGWTAAIFFIAGWHYVEEGGRTQQLANIQAQQSCLVFLHWVAGHGGIYVPVTEQTLPNLYLGHIENHDVTTTSGLQLTLMNPAYVLRQVHELGREYYGQQHHLTSLNPLWSENAPDAWETDALRAFAHGDTEVTALAKIGDTEYLRLMRPLITEAPCLKCHAAQGYEVGDLRGGISVSVPMLPLRTLMHSPLTTIFMGYSLIWLLGLGGIAFGSAYLGRCGRRGEQVEKESVRFSRVLEHSLNEIFLFDAETLRFIEVNKGALQNLGYSLEELRGLTPRDINPELTDEAFAKQIELLRTGAEEKIQITTVHQRKDGSLYPVETHLQLITDDAPVFLAIVLDITMRKQAEQERDRLMYAIEQSAEIVLITDRAGMIQYVNPSFEQITGYTNEEAIGRNPRFLQSGEQDDNFYKEMWATLSCGELWKGRFVNRKKDGTFYTEEASISPVRDNSGSIINFVAVKHDITQEIVLEEQLRQAQKMEAVGQLAGGVAHDFNNMLSVILGYAEMAQAKVAPGSSIGLNLEAIRKAAERSAELTRQLLAFSRKQTLSPKVINLNELMNNMEKMLRRVIGADIVFNTDYADNLDFVQADPGQVEQILMDLTINARDAMPDGGNLTIKTTNVELDEQYAQSHIGASAGHYVLLTVSDTGCGMDVATKARIFEPFFTTKETGQGTGLGLSTVYGIVKQSGGYIWCCSEPGKGTTFEVYLPRTDASPIDNEERN
jgi:PAS domain S-box-containing protein